MNWNLIFFIRKTGVLKVIRIQIDYINFYLNLDYKYLLLMDKHRNVIPVNFSYMLYLKQYFLKNNRFEEKNNDKDLRLLYLSYNVG